MVRRMLLSPSAVSVDIEPKSILSKGLSDDLSEMALLRSITRTDLSSTLISLSPLETSPEMIPNMTKKATRTVIKQPVMEASIILKNSFIFFLVFGFVKVRNLFSLIPFNRQALNAYIQERFKNRTTLDAQRQSLKAIYIRL
ncbi:hypothetical protein SDC9_39321 [bioreactor metagenome]|uniref:Uncharacterized protein n=1 Tax=bioreactor metagenome TaxID=1076179 RepID=A0A644VPB6_9ZZZZ